MICLASLVYPLKLSGLIIQHISVVDITAKISPVHLQPPAKSVQIPAGESTTFDIGSVGVSLVLIEDGEEKSVESESLIYTVAYLLS